MHIAILDADIPVPAVYARRGLYSSQFKKLLQEAAARVHESPSQIHTTAYDVVGGCLPSLDSLRKQPHSPSTTTTVATNGASDNNSNTNPLTHPIDGILITGSSSGVYATATHPWITPLQTFIQTVFTCYPHVRLFGACFGHQIIAQALLYPSVHVEACPAGFEIGPVDISLSEPFARAFAGPFRDLRAGPECMRLQMVHGDWVVPASHKYHKNEEEEKGCGGLPSPWVNVGSSAACAVQGLYYPGRVLTFQGHFEFDGFVNRETCREFGRRLEWGEERIGRVLEEIGGSGDEAGVDDSEVAAEVVLRFFEGRDQGV
ncbi:type 1 glutamine amidotransferase [Aspergillus candidus]|uniref:Class I glutamine amidotransferase-like protein n=1 Tax=Aspergillus candidus TaxID=41067 RepID=A0A2I2FL00_ASPCN|nr:class I glutamine amidotransferase-like protein [Aspergillus candidus]PLB41293.1 class I glutamine amidotransferase-like protein [Aspergillus candidus]